VGEARVPAVFQCVGLFRRRHSHLRDDCPGRRRGRDADRDFLPRGSAYGSATFDSTTSQRNESLATMSYDFRDPAYIGSSTGFMNQFWYYDMDGNKRFDHFSCEFDSGYAGNSTCWAYGS
jgi:hypothetical protein